MSLSGIRVRHRDPIQCSLTIRSRSQMAGAPVRRRARMTRREGGVGIAPGKKRAEGKRGAQQPSKASARDTAADMRDAEALAGLASHTSPPSACSMPPCAPTRPPAAHGSVRYHRERADAAEAKFKNEHELKRAAHARARASEEKLERAREKSAKRLQDRNSARESERAWCEQAHEFEDEIEGLVSEPIVADLPAVGKEPRGKGGGSGRAAFPMWIVQLILEQLIHGTPPSAIPDNILSQDRLTTGRVGQQLPSVAFCRDMRIVLPQAAAAAAAPCGHHDRRSPKASSRRPEGWVGGGDGGDRVGVGGGDSSNPSAPLAATSARLISRWWRAASSSLSDSIRLR